MLVRPQLEGVALAKVRPVNYPAPDGTLIPGYLTCPASGTGKNLPAIVLPHGGPTARDDGASTGFPSISPARVMPSCTKLPWLRAMATSG
jgi:dipeptidyl aminopeptidase/acylaminoacyl peptidase